MQLCVGWVCGQALGARLAAFVDSSLFMYSLRSFWRATSHDRGGSRWLRLLEERAAAAGVGSGLGLPLVEGVGVVCPLLAALLAAAAAYGIGSALLLLGPGGISGRDHFYPEEHKRRGLCRDRGAYAWVAHPLFYLGMLLPWAAAVWRRSEAGLALALAMHGSALAFLGCIELPDIAAIYGEQAKATAKVKEKAP